MGYHLRGADPPFSELSNETAGEHFTPREVIRLMVDLLFIEDDDALRQPGAVRTLYDPAAAPAACCPSPSSTCASSTPRPARGLRPGAQPRDLRDLPVRHDAQGPRPDRIASGNSLHRRRPSAATRFDYLLANPPFGVDWKKVEDAIRSRGTRPRRLDGRFGAGLPRINDGSFLFLQHMIAR